MLKSLRSKFIFVILALVFTVLGQVLISSITQHKLIENQQALGRSYANVGLVHELERVLVDLQRNLLVYKETGSKNSISKFEELMADAQHKLTLLNTNLDVQTAIKLETALLQRMGNHLKDYNENFKNILKTRESQTQILKDHIIPNFATLRQLAEDFENESIKYEVKYLLVLAEKTLNQYLSSPDFEYVQKLNVSLENISQLITTHKALDERIAEQFNALKRSVAQLTLTTRGYVFLVNVVMAGSANEFLILTENLRESVIEQQQFLNAETSAFATESEIKNNGTALIAIFMLLLISFFLARKILAPINSLTSVFSKLSKDEEIADIPGTRRDDEIGALAKAAKIFQEKNQQTSYLLREAREMNQRKEELNAALEVEKIRAEAAAKSKAMFLANMSHEIRTPMNGIIGLVQLLEKTELNEQQAHYLKKVAFSGKIMMNVINDILDFSKIEAGKLEIEYVNFEVDDLIENLIANLTPKLYEKDVNFSVFFSPNLPKTVLGDPLRISQIVLNLCNNAIKFTSQGEITLSFTYEQTRTRKQLIIDVKDTGIGMSPEQLAGIFDSFSQADGSTSRKFGGTGLGLSIVKQLAHLMNGSVDVNSTKGVGSHFSVKLALRDSSRELLFEGSEDADDLEIFYLSDGQHPLYPLEFLPKQTLNITHSNWQSILKDISDSHASRKHLLIDAPSIESIKQHENKVKGLQAKTDHFLFLCHNNQFELHHHLESKLHGHILTLPFAPSQLLGFLKGQFESNPQPHSHSEEDVQDQHTAQLTGHVLIVEDNRINQLVASHMVKSFGLTFEMANNGLEAVGMVQSGTQFDLVLMDVQMPVMDGYDATKEIRKLGFQDLPICGLSANAMEKDAEVAKQAGMNDYLTKPIEVSALESILQKYLKQNNA